MKKKKEKIRLEGTIEKEHSNANSISLKEVFERLVGLEAKFDFQIQRGASQARFFWGIVVTLLLVEMINFVMNLLLYYK